MNMSTGMTPNLSYFNSLPDDIIFQIFYQGTFGDQHNARASLMPLIYSQVCHKWRALTLEASWLWSLITFRDDEEPYTLTRLYLQRSRSAALTIEIDVTDINFDPDDDMFWLTEEDLEGRMSLLVPHANRWRSFACWTDNWVPLSYVVSQLAIVELPLLKSLTLGQMFPDPHEYPPVPPVLPSHTTSIAAPLDRLDLHGVSLDLRRLSDLGLNLTYLSLCPSPPSQQPLYVDDFFGVIRNASATLRHLSLQGVCYYCDTEGLPLITQPVFLPNLEQFSFEPSQDGPMRCDLECFAKLLILFEFGGKLSSVSLTRFFEDPHFEDFIPVLASKFGGVKHLSIGQMSMTYRQFAQWLNVLPHLTSLCIVDQYFQPVALEVLAAPPEQFGILTTPILCPLLQAISMRNLFGGLVFLVVATSFEAERPLRSIIWKAPHREAVKSMAYLLNLKAHIEILYEGPDTAANDL